MTNGIIVTFPRLTMYARLINIGRRRQLGEQPLGTNGLEVVVSSR